MKLNCIAVDDEPLALGLVSLFIEKTPFLHLTGKYLSAVEALQALHSQQVDVIFLDIQMPDLTGIELARVLNQSQQNGTGPRIIFTTAFNNFAIEGYKVDALDYLLKPFNYEEFLRAATKAKTYYEMFQRTATPVAVVAPEPEEESLFLKVEYQLVRVAFKDILYIEGLKDYVKVYVQGSTKPILSLTSLKALEEKLPAKRFMRVHRSYIVSLEKINSLMRNSIQIGTVTIPVSEQYKEAFNAFVSKWV
jgi:two-component system, LytTR family, response regulator LytT